jgi:hypothetical protein
MVATAWMARRMPRCVAERLGRADCQKGCVVRWFESVETRRSHASSGWSDVSGGDGIAGAANDVVVSGVGRIGIGSSRGDGAGVVMVENSGVAGEGRQEFEAVLETDEFDRECFDEVEARLVTLLVVVVAVAAVVLLLPELGILACAFLGRMVS